MPHIGLALQNNGDFCTCNTNDWSFQNKKREVLFVYKDSIKDAWNSHIRKLIGAGLDHGKELPSCATCFDVERSGGESRRQFFNEAFRYFTPNSDQPVVFILKPGNTCNLACRMCNPQTSSGWYSDAHTLAVKHENYTGSCHEFTKGFETIRNSFHRDNTELWDTFAQWLPNLKFLDVYGGEPFLTPAMFETFERVEDLSEVSIQMHTNGSHFNERYLNALARFKSVNLGISIDSTDHKQLEYIRHLLDTDLLFENLNKFKDWASKHPNVTLHICNTITPLNIMYVKDTHEKLTEMTGLRVTLNFVTGPTEYDIRNIPTPVKEKLAENLKDLKQVVDFMSQSTGDSDTAWPRFWEVTKQLDAIRGQSFEETFPEFYELIKDYV